MNRNLIFSISAALLLGSACQKVEVPAALAESSEILIGVSQEGTKSYLMPSSGKVFWEDADELKLFSNLSVDGVKFVMKENSGTSAIFTNRIDEETEPSPVSGNTFYALFPYSESLSFDGTAFGLELPSYNTFVPGSFGPDANPMIGRTSDLSAPFQMKNLCGLVRISLTGESKIMSVALTLDKPISGHATLGINDEFLSVAAGESKTTTVSSLSGIRLNNDSATDFYFVVPVNSYGHVDVEITDDRGFCTRISKDVNFSVKRAGIVKMAAHEESDGFIVGLEGFTEESIEDIAKPRVRTIVQVTSFNIKNQSDDDDAPVSQDWNPTRREAVKAYFNTVGPAVVCSQECEHRQKEWLLSNCSGYAAYGRGSDYGKDSGGRGGFLNLEDYDKDAGNYIFYRTDRYDLLDSGTYWLSSSPTSVSKFSSSNHYRCCSWVKLQDKETQGCFYVFSTHLHQGYDGSDDSVRSRQLDVLYNYAAGSINASGLPMVITGDLNMTTTGSCLQTFKESGKMQFARNVWNREWDDTHKSYNGWGSTSIASNIDHIMYKGFTKLRRFWTDNTRYNGVIMSDHYPLTAELEFY